MRRVLSALSLTLLAVPLVGTDALASESADLSLVKCGPLTCVEASGPNGGTLRLVLDTGNEDSVLSTDAAARLKLGTTPAHRADGSEVKGYSMTQPTVLELGGVKLAPSELAVADLSKYAQAIGAPIDGTLSYVQLKGWIVDMDLKNGKARLDRKSVV